MCIDKGWFLGWGAQLAYSWIGGIARAWFPLAGGCVADRRCLGAGADISRRGVDPEQVCSEGGVRGGERELAGAVVEASRAWFCFSGQKQLTVVCAVLVREVELHAIHLQSREGGGAGGIGWGRRGRIGPRIERTVQETGSSAGSRNRGAR